MNESLAKDALRTIEALRRRVAELESDIAKARGTVPVDKSGLKGAIAQATSRGLPNSYRVRGVDTGKLIEKTAKSRKRQ